MSGQGGKITRGMAVFLLTVFDEFHRKRVNAVASVGRGMVLALEHVAQMSSAIGAFNFDSNPIRIRELLYSTFNLLVEGGPAAAGIKLTGGFVEWGVASPAVIGPRFIKIVVLT